MLNRTENKILIRYNMDYILFLWRLILSRTSNVGQNFHVLLPKTPDNPLDRNISDVSFTIKFKQALISQLNSERSQLNQNTASLINRNFNLNNIENIDEEEINDGIKDVAGAIIFLTDGAVEISDALSRFAQDFNNTVLRSPALRGLYPAMMAITGLDALERQL